MAGDDLDDWIDKVLEADPLPTDVEEIDEPSGPPLSAEDIERAEEALARWQPAVEFKASVDALCARCVSRDWFNRPQLSSFTTPSF